MRTRTNCQSGPWVGHWAERRGPTFPREGQKSPFASSGHCQIIGGAKGTRLGSNLQYSRAPSLTARGPESDTEPFGPLGVGYSRESRFFGL